MINDIRFQASKLINFSTDTDFQNNGLNASGGKNTFEEIFNEQNSEKTIGNSGISSFQLGIPAGFEIDFSLLEEMENNNNK